jgi:hypothetical protein
LVACQTSFEICDEMAITGPKSYGGPREISNALCLLSQSVQRF